MNRYHFIAAVLLLTVGALCAGCFAVSGVQGSGVAKTEARDVPAFTGVAIAGAADVTITVDPSKPQSVTITTDDNLLPIVQTTVKKDTLTIDTKQNISTRLGVKVAISVQQLDAASIAGSGDLDAHGIHSKRFSVSVQGSGTAKLDGTADVLDASIAGSGNIDAAKLPADDVSVSIAGSGDASVNANKTLKASVSGSGDVKYLGSPSVTKQISGSGSVRAGK